MEQFSAVGFYDIAARLYYLQAALGEANANEMHGTQPFKPQGSAFIALTNIRKECSKIGLKASIKCVDNVLEFGSEGTTTGNIRQGLNELARLIRWEMEEHLFLFIAPSRAGRYDQTEAFGTEVATNFPSAAFDIRESGNCYAAARYTACVFHLMRSLELGLTAFARIFSVPSDRTNWHNIIQDIEKEIRNMGNDPNKTADWKVKQEVYSQIASSFMIFKDAWRNYTAHARGKYLEEEADAIYRNVQAFMKRLAESGISE
jgi:hypothetical protein